MLDTRGPSGRKMNMSNLHGANGTKNRKRTECLHKPGRAFINSKTKQDQICISFLKQPLNLLWQNELYSARHCIYE